MSSVHTSISPIESALKYRNKPHAVLTADYKYIQDRFFPHMTSLVFDLILDSLTTLTTKSLHILSVFLSQILLIFLSSSLL